MRQLILVVALLLAGLTSKACDVCGGASMNTGFGYIPLQKQHIVGLNHTYNLFNTTHPGMIPETVSTDKFQTLDLWMRVFLTNKIMLTANVPYRYNRIDMGNTTYTSNGIGDLSLQLYGRLWNSGSTYSKFQTMWLAGAGIKAPTGESGVTFENDKVIQNIQNGSGAWDVVLASNFSIRKKNYGLNHEISYSFNGVNSEEYKFGNRLNSRLLAFYQLNVKNHSLVPQLGIGYQHFQKDLIWASRSIEKLYSGRTVVNANIGLDIYKKQYGLRLSTEIPLNQEISGGYVKSIINTRVQFLYFFQSIKPKNEQNNE